MTGGLGKRAAAGPAGLFLHRSWTIRVIVVKDNTWTPILYKYFPEVSCLLYTVCAKSLGQPGPGGA